MPEVNINIQISAYGEENARELFELAMKEIVPDGAERLVAGETEGLACVLTWH